MSWRHDLLKFTIERELLLPPGGGTLLDDVRTFLRSKLGRSRLSTLQAAPTAKGNGGGILAVRRGYLRYPILDLAAGDVDHQLGELGGVAWTFEALVWHGCNMRRSSSSF